MKFKIQLKVGRNVIQVEDDAVKTTDLVHKLAFLQSLPEVCGHCNSEDIQLDHRLAKKFHFYEVKCRNPECRHKLRMGQYQDGGELFTKQWGPPGAPEEDAG